MNTPTVTQDPSPHWYKPGSPIRFKLDTRVLSDSNVYQLADAAGVQLTIHAPDGTDLVFTPIHDGDGLYHYDWVGPMDAIPDDLWVERWQAINPAAADNLLEEKHFGFKRLYY